MILSLLTMVIATGGRYDVWPEIQTMYEQKDYISCYSIETDTSICVNRYDIDWMFSHHDNVSWSNWVAFSPVMAEIKWVFYYACNVPVNPYFDLDRSERVHY